MTSDGKQVVAREVFDARALLETVELVGVTVYELRAKRIDASAGERTPTPEPQWGFMERHSDSQLEYRFQMALQATDAEFFTEIGLVYEFNEPVMPTASAVLDFVEKVAIMAAFPFFRESVFTSATRLGVRVPVMGLLKQGAFKIDRPVAPELDA